MSNPVSESEWFDNYLSFWKSNKKGKLIADIKKELISRSGKTCVHCERRYDDDICNDCFSKRLADVFQESLTGGSNG